MSEGEVHIPTSAWRRFQSLARDFFTSPVKTRAWWLTGALVVLMFAINGLNVFNSYVGRDFFSAIERRNTPTFIGLTFAYLGVFALLTTAAVIFRFCEERLGLLWREWLTKLTVEYYLNRRVYFHLHESGGVENIDQRISDDIKAFTTSTLSFLLLLLNGSFTVLAFSGVLWSISWRLFVVAVLYAGVGSFLTVKFGKSLVGLNYKQLDREADFRADLLHIREHADSIALLHRERRMHSRLLFRLGELVANMRRMIAVNRNLGFFTTGYNYLIQIIPALIVAPLFIGGKVEFGVIAQSSMAFAHLLGAFSLIVTQFQSISSYTAVIARLGNMGDAMEAAAKREDRMVAVCESCGLIRFDHVTLRSPKNSRLLLADFTLEIPAGMNVLIAGPNTSGKIALFRATAGVWNAGEGTITRPDLDRVFFVPERPYLIPSSLRDALLRTGAESVVPVEELEAHLRELGLESVLHRAAGVDTVMEWDDVTSLSEQQLLVAARLLLSRPEFAVLDRIGTALSPAEVNLVLAKLRARGITYLTIGTDGGQLKNYDLVVYVTEDGAWRTAKVADGQIGDDGVQI